jgi:hypothetical protein
MRAPDNNGLHPPPYESKRIAVEREDRQDREEEQQRERESGEIEGSDMEDGNMQEPLSQSKTERTGRKDRL